jgi:hypothetical protein
MPKSKKSCGLKFAPNPVTLTQLKLFEQPLLMNDFSSKTRTQSYDRDLQRQRCNFLQRNG